MLDRNPKLYHAASSYYSMIARYSLILADIPFESHLLDIHRTKQQLQDWYIAINPAMTVPSLVSQSTALCSSADIVQFAIETKRDCWLDTGACAQSLQRIDHLNGLHDEFPLERLTFNAFMQKVPPLRKAFPHLLRRMCTDLEKRIQSERHPELLPALRAKLKQNQQRLAYFSSDTLANRQDQMILAARELIAAFPDSPRGAWLFGSLPSSADVRLLVFLARLQMIGLVHRVGVNAALVSWFLAKSQTSAFHKADIWTKFHLWRVLTHR